MAKRESGKQSLHDDVIRSYSKKLEKKGRIVVTNPGNERNETWNGEYIDIIAKNNDDKSRAVVIEVETSDSITNTEAEHQWSNYNKAFDPWFLAVPQKSIRDAEKFIKKFNLDTCRLITWKSSNGFYSFNEIPG